VAKSNNSKLRYTHLNIENADFASVYRILRLFQHITSPTDTFCDDTRN